MSWKIRLCIQGDIPLFVQYGLYIRLLWIRSSSNMEYTIVQNGLQRYAEVK